MVTRPVIFGPSDARNVLAREQLGTIGSGNRYVDLFEDRADDSLDRGALRGFGRRTTSGFLALCEGSRLRRLALEILNSRF